MPTSTEKRVHGGDADARAIIDRDTNGYDPTNAYPHSDTAGLGQLPRHINTIEQRHDGYA